MLAALALILTPLVVQSTRGGDDQDKGQEKASSVWMKLKLSASQNILAGLTKADFEVIEKNAQSMLFMDHLEKWLRATRRAITRN